MKQYVLKTFDYYSCECTGRFFVDIQKDSRDIFPCVYRYLCDKCGKEKFMPCEAEVKACSMVSNI